MQTIIDTRKWNCLFKKNAPSITYNFQSLYNALNFVARANESLYIFKAPKTGYIVVGRAAAKTLWDKGQLDIVE